MEIDDSEILMDLAANAEIHGKYIELKLLPSAGPSLGLNSDNMTVQKNSDVLVLRKNLFLSYLRTSCNHKESQMKRFLLNLLIFINI